MIGYVTLGTNDKKKAEKFYDELLKEIGGGRFMETEQFTAYSASPDKPGIGITVPYDGKPATAGNGTMIALKVDSAQKVNSFYNKAMSLGAKDEGKPGPRGESGFYAAYFRDLDGNKLNVFCFESKNNKL
jgi:catechol 2,3-dioxygenase-like lactoylglutathione lyase family enzyme